MSDSLGLHGRFCGDQDPESPVSCTRLCLTEIQGISAATIIRLVDHIKSILAKARLLRASNGVCVHDRSMADKIHSRRWVSGGQTSGVDFRAALTNTRRSSRSVASTIVLDLGSPGRAKDDGVVSPDGRC